MVASFPNRRKTTCATSSCRSAPFNPQSGPERESCRAEVSAGREHPPSQVGPKDMSLDLYQYGIATICGALLGFTLGLLGGGGSILAVPLLVHAVGLANAHVAIATSAVAVAANALIS